jgi:hypothetical protein
MAGPGDFRINDEDLTTSGRSTDAVVRARKLPVLDSASFWDRMAHGISKEFSFFRAVPRKVGDIRPGVEPVTDPGS